MLKRLVTGLLKGVIVGAAIGAGIQYGLAWQVESGGLLGYLLAMGAGGTTGVFAGRPPWSEGAWIEAALKGTVGVGLSALAYWGISTWAAFTVSLPGLGAPAPWTGLPVLFLPAIAGVYGALVELDHTDEEAADRGTDKSARKGPKARVGDEYEEAELGPAENRKAARDGKG
jgi:hypothetical protein